MAGEQRLHPAEITVIVSSASGLPSSKSGKCRASVIFGVGKTKFRTQVFDSNNPVWNERSTVPVTEGDASPLVFQVTRKDRPMGEVCIPLDRIPGKCTAPHCVPLAACRDCSSPVGSLTYECWVSKRYDSGMAPGMEIVRTKSMRMRVGSSFRGNFRRGSDASSLTKQTESDPAGSRSPRPRSTCTSPQQQQVQRASPAAGSSLRNGGGEESSLHPDTTPEGSRRSSSVRGKNIEEAMRRRFSFAKADDPRPSSSQPNLSTIGVAKEHTLPIPRVTGISPRDGTMAGGTVITLRGENLGTDVGDINTVTVCGVACDLADLEYISASKLVCRTPAGKTGTGPVEVETVAQGRGSSTVTFTYWDPSQEPEDRVPVLVEADTVASITSSINDGSAAASLTSTKKKRFGQSISRTSMRDSGHQADDNKDTVIQELTGRVAQLEQDNSRLNIYIEKLVAKVMVCDPDILAS